MTILASVNNKTLMPGITPIADVPDRPTIGTATAGEASASVTFTASTTGGVPTTFTATSNPGSITGTAASSPVTVSGLNGGTSYTFTVTASNSTGTSPASSASNSVVPSNPIDGAYDALARITVPSGGLSSVIFAGIPTGYKQLQIRTITACSAGANPGTRVTFNNDTTSSNYRYHYLVGTGTSALAGSNNSSDFFTAGGAVTTSPGTGVIDILDYANTNKNKTIRTLSGYDANGSGTVSVFSGLWMNTNAITTIQLAPASGSWNQHSFFALYGVK
jgi:hypothetical protein